MGGVSPFLLRGLLTMAVVAAAVLSPSSAASSEEQLRANLRSCLAIPNALRRLDCFDRLARDTDNGGTASSASPGAAASGNSDVGGTGARAGSSARPADADIRSRVTRLEQRPRGEWVFHLHNGQTWTEIEPGRTQYEVGAEVRVSRTLFGSYMLSVEGVRATRVRRLE